MRAALAAEVTPIGAGWGYAGGQALRDAGAAVVLHDPGWIGPGLLDHRVTASATARSR
ncbi:hypothetical protein [Streptomyces sp. 8K308]|uniref:hypothetical protein n=1 Tax=Streptomyces sp. 8K308 TaxID=2530388 RepID=UPI001FB81FDA|nr:hypothetical protein [Streptomyces sp. 8K308]